MSRRALRAIALAVVGLLAGCGIPPDGAARAVQPPPGPYLLPTSAPPTGPSGVVVEQLFFVSGDKLAPVQRKVDSLGTPQHQLTELLAGPTDAETVAGLRSALPGSSVIGGITVTNEIATVVLDAELDGTGKNDEVLAFGQVVCTLDARDDISGVLFKQDGQTVAVPRATGELSLGPLTTADYADLLT